MSLYGYKKKGKPALYLQLPSERAAKKWADEGAAERKAERKQNKLETKRSRIRQRAERHKSEDSIYNKENTASIKQAQKEERICPVYQQMALGKLPENVVKYLSRYGASSKTTQTHHVFGRVGKLLNWKPGHLLVSKRGHRIIHMFPNLSAKFGWLVPGVPWNDYERAAVWMDEKNSVENALIKAVNDYKDFHEDLLK